MADSPDDWPDTVERLLAGDRLAFLKINRLVSGFLAKLGAYDMRDEWDDLRQEVVLALVANARAGRLRDPDKLLAYIRVITRNKFFDRLGQGGRRQGTRALPWDDTTERSHVAQTVDSRAEDRVVDVWREARDLAPQQQQVLDGVYRQGKTYQEVADDTGIPLGTVKRRLREALTLLRRRFGGVAGEN